MFLLTNFDPSVNHTPTHTCKTFPFLLFELCHFHNHDTTFFTHLKVKSCIFTGFIAVHLCICSVFKNRRGDLQPDAEANMSLASKYAQKQYNK